MFANINFAIDCKKAISCSIVNILKQVFLRIFDCVSRNNNCLFFANIIFREINSEIDNLENNREKQEFLFFQNCVLFIENLRFDNF